jgi:hypothetical protein
MAVGKKGGGGGGGNCSTMIAVSDRGAVATMIGMVVVVVHGDGMQWWRACAGEREVVAIGKASLARSL